MNIQKTDMKNHNNIASKVSVVIVSYDSLPEIIECISSLEGEQAVHEIVIVDNNSDDKTVESINTEELTVVELRSNVGFGQAVNIGVNEASYDLICCLNPDTMIREEAITYLVNQLQSTSADIVTPTICDMENKETIATLGRSVNFLGISQSRYSGEDIERVKSDHLCECVSISGAAFVTSRDVWQDIGGFDENIFMYKEDIILSLDAITSGYKIAAVPNSVVYHDHNPEITFEKLHNVEKGRYYLIREFYNPVQILLLSPSIIVFDVMTWPFFIRHGVEGVKAKASTYSGIKGSDGGRSLSNELVDMLDATIEPNSLLDESELRIHQVLMIYLLNKLLWVNWFIFKKLYVGE